MAEARVAEFQPGQAVEIVGKDHPRKGQTVLVESVPVPAKDAEQTYDCVTKDSRHQFSALESELAVPKKRK